MNVSVISKAVELLLYCLTFTAMSGMHQTLMFTGMTEVLQECLKATGMYHRGCHRGASQGCVSGRCHTMVSQGCLGHHRGVSPGMCHRDASQTVS
jgi:hypothetical protein